MNALSKLYENKPDTEVPSYFLSGMMNTMMGGMRNMLGAGVNASLDSQMNVPTKEEIAARDKAALEEASRLMDAYSSRQSVTNNPNLPSSKPEYYIDSLDAQRALYSMMNTDAEVYNIDSTDKARSLFGMLNPGAEYISSTEHMFDDYVRRNPDLMKVAETGRDPDGSSADWLRGVNELWQLGQRHYMGHGKREGRNLRGPGMYLNGAKVDESLLPKVGGYYFKDGREFTNDMLPSYGYYDENLRQVAPEKNSALLDILANAQNPDAERQEYYDPVLYPEMENLNPIAKRNMALRNDVTRRAPDAVYANNYLEWMKGQQDLMDDFELNFNMSDHYGQKDVQGMRNLMSMYAKAKYDEGVGNREMPQYRMEQILPQKERYDGNYRETMSRLYQPVASTRSQRNLGGTDKSRGLSALLNAMV